jgi:hypothetical protein
MRSEEILLREAEYRAIREALGTYDVALVLAEPCRQMPPESCVPAVSQCPGGLPSSGTPSKSPPGRGDLQAPMDS